MSSASNGLRISLDMQWVCTPVGLYDRNPMSLQEFTPVVGLSFRGCTRVGYPPRAAPGLVIFPGCIAGYLSSRGAPQVTYTPGAPPRVTNVTPFQAWEIPAHSSWQKLAISCIIRLHQRIYIPGICTPGAVPRVTNYNALSGLGDTSS
jgi:hypothetical protein